jgi:hypothetical protein
MTVKVDTTKDSQLDCIPEGAEGVGKAGKFIKVFSRTVCDISLRDVLLRQKRV